MNDLYPAGLEEFGVVRLMEHELDGLQEDMGCLVEFVDDCPIKAAHEVEITLYRILHEALINIRRHAPNVKNVGVLLKFKNQIALLQVQDDGPGFDIEELTGGGPVGGLMNTRE